MSDLAVIEAQLRSRLADLLVEARQIDAELSTPHSKDWEDRATELESDEVLEELGHVAMAEAEQIRAALGRIADGSYGICTRCGEPVGEERLRAVAYAALCIDCANASSGGTGAPPDNRQ